MIYHRKYNTYQEYVGRQGTKANSLQYSNKIIGKAENKITNFMKQFDTFKKVLLSGKVLCLGARTGYEVRAMQRLGFKDSIGVDLWPLGEYVIKGDWHDLPFDDQSFENVYCNSLDHCCDFEKFVAEVNRVLVPNGRFVYLSHTYYALDSRLPNLPIDIQAIINGKSDVNPNNAMWWDSLKDIADRFCQDGYKIIHSFKHRKWSGYVLRKP